MVMKFIEFNAPYYINISRCIIDEYTMQKLSAEKDTK